jgi:DNA invertase Pin-like site-specific DNA recombinase
MNTTNAKSLRAALYIRVSSESQSTELQHRQLLEYAERRGWQVEAIYEETITGTHGNRPRLKACLADAKLRKFDVLCVWKLDRFARSLQALLTDLQSLQDWGVQFCSMNDPLDLTSSSGKLMCSMIGAFAEFEASLIKSRVRAGIENARAKGKHLGRPARIDSDKVRLLRIEGHSLSQIAKASGCTRSAVSKILARSLVNKPVKKPGTTGEAK